MEQMKNAHMIYGFIIELQTTTLNTDFHYEP